MRNPRRPLRSIIPRVGTLKIDKDCLIPRDWIRDYVRLILTVARWFDVEVNSIKMCESLHKGSHYYIQLTRAVSADLANRLQYILGDDCQRVTRNAARIRSGLKEWNLLFERPHVKLRTIYPLKVLARTKTAAKKR